MTKHSQSHPIKIIMADDHELIRVGFRNFLQNLPFIQLVAEAANGEQLIQLTKIHDPDIVLTDIQMPVMNGIEATRIITEKYPGTGVIALTMFNLDYYIADMLMAGAKGFILKHAHPPLIIEAIIAVNNNEHYYCPNTTEKLKLLILNKKYNPVTKAWKISLTPRETEVMKLICEQKSNNEIAIILKISVRTVEEFRSKLLFKTQTQNIAGLVIFAMRHGIYNP